MRANEWLKPSIGFELIWMIQTSFRGNFKITYGMKPEIKTFFK